MISGGSGDERKGLSLRFGFEGERMELEAEIEEGEACFRNINDDDSPIDPDVALSYIDEKIQNVLGHCRKDFEGGVSAENLGAKFGGYGSFLPTYQRSPIWPQSKTPPEVIAYSAPSSPNNAHIEVGHQNSSSQTSASQPTRHGQASFSAGSVPAPRGSSMNGKLKQEVPIKCSDQSTLNDQRSVNNFTDDSDQKSLKVRIKVGSDNFSTRKNAEIYSGLGLDVSPSSSLEASPVDSDGFIHLSHDIPDESPTSILEIMTSFPVSGSILLSPLPYDVLHLMEKEKLEDLSCEPVHKGSQESTLTALHGSDPGKVDQNVVGEKQKSSNKNSASMESTDGDDVCNGIEVLPKKEMSLDNLAPGTSSSEAKQKSKDQALDNGSRNIDSKGGVKNSSFASTSKNNTYGSKSCMEDLKKNSGKVRETYKDFFGELDLEQEDSDEMALEKPCGGNKVKGTLDSKGLSQERLIGKGSQKPSSSRVGSHVPPTASSEATAATVAPVVNEDWVCCDKCEKWRLLPPGVNPGSLPEKWLCSMLDWLPGMNRCSISEEETTKAITSRFPGPSVQGSQPVHPGGPQLVALSLDVTRPDVLQQHVRLQIPSKKKHGSKDLGIEAKQDRPSMSSNSTKKNLHTSYRSISLNAANQSPLINDVEFQDSGQSRDVITEKDRLKEKLNNRLRGNSMDEGNNIHQSKISNKRGSTQDFRKDSKKIKTEGNDGTAHMEKFDKREASNKRKKVNELEDPGQYPKETSETNRRKEKKARALNTEDEAIRVNKGKIIEDVKLRSLDVIGRDMVLAATSSSSKVSGSHKTKTNNHEVKGSPVESVSSSPLRIFNNIRGVEPLKKNLAIRPYEEKPKGGTKVNGSSSMLSENVKSFGQSKHKHREGSHVRNGAISSQDSKKASKRDVSRRGKSHSLPPRGHNEIERIPQPLPGSRKENGGDTMSIKVLKQNKKTENQKENQSMNVKHPAPNERKGKGHDGPVLLVRDISNQATTNALREATNLKHMADRVKNGGSSVDSRALYMQAALKFLHVASLFESCHSQTGRYGDMIQSMSIYSSTAKLCEYCAHEYERTKEMATAALAYKCMEVAYMKVIYSSHATACKDVNELKTSLQIAPMGESPSSSASASDLDNLNNLATVDKAALAKGVDASQVAGNHVIAARNKPNFTRILNFTQDVNSAMEASRKSRIAFAASSSKEEAGLSAVKTALDFNFHDVGGLLHLVRVAMEAINR